MKDLVNRKNNILAKILRRCESEDRGFTINGLPSFCLIWKGPTSGNGRGGGYGRICIEGITAAVHIVMFTLIYGYIPKGKQIDHLCNQRDCCNHLHLDLVTHKENQRRRNLRRVCT